MNKFLTFLFTSLLFFSVSYAEVVKKIIIKGNKRVSEETIKGQLRVKNPNFKNSDKSVNFNVQSLETDKLTDSGYKTNKTGFGFGTNFEYQDDVFIGLGQDSYYEKIETNNSASASQKSQAGNYWDTFLNLDLGCFSIWAVVQNNTHVLTGSKFYLRSSASVCM